MCSDTDDNTMNHNTSGHSTNGRSTRDRNTKDRSNMCARSTSNRYPNNNPSTIHPKIYHQQASNAGDRNDGTGTDGVSGNNPRRHHCNHRHMSLHIGHNFRRGSLHILCHVYIWWERRPASFRPHNRSGWFRRYNGGYTHRDHGLL